MAATVDHLREVYGRDLRERLHQNLVVAGLCNTDFTGDVNRAYEVHITSRQNEIGQNSLKREEFLSPSSVVFREKDLDDESGVSIGHHIGCG